MSVDLIQLLAYVLLALGVSFLCSIAEAVLLSITPAYMEGLEQGKPGQAALLKEVKLERIEQSLAAILSLNTIAHTVGAIGAGAKATAVFGSAWFGLFSAVMTLMILLLSEILPKTIGALYWTQLALPTAWFLKILIRAIYPVVWVCEGLTRLVTRGRKAHVFSRDEFLAMARLGLKHGELKESELKVVSHLIRFSSRKAADAMTPRTVLAALPEAALLRECEDFVSQHPFSRLPVYREDIDHISGFVLRADLLAALAAGEGQRPLVEFKREIQPVPASLPLGQVLEMLHSRQQHIAIVIGEFGDTVGLITLEDLLENLTGMEIVDELDPAPDMRGLARSRWKERAGRLKGRVSD
jgi:CBS domain containing-hemolysin-like protein